MRNRSYHPLILLARLTYSYSLVIVVFGLGDDTHVATRISRLILFNRASSLNANYIFYLCALSASRIHKVSFDGVANVFIGG